MISIENSVKRVKATMEIEGFKLNKNDTKRLMMIGEKQLNGDKVIEKYIRRVTKLTGAK
jgi:hypothetical protein